MKLKKSLTQERAERKLERIKREQRKVAKKIVETYFTDDTDEAIVLTDSQADLFNMVFLQKHNRCQVITATQFGKTMTVALALIITTQVLKQDFVVLAGSGEKAQLIMDKVIEHTFDHSAILSQLEYDKEESLSRIKQKKSRSHIVWKNGGSIRIVSADTRNKKRVKEALTGHGGRHIIAEEASLIPDDVWGMAMRMLGDIKGTFLLKIGNAVYRNHFYRSSENPQYHQLLVDWRLALKEGRYSQEYIDEMRENMDNELFRNFYECEFPPRDEADHDGFRFLLTESQLKKCKVLTIPRNYKNEEKKLGGDIGEGNDLSAYVSRGAKFAMITKTNSIVDTMQQLPVIQELLKSDNISEAFIDSIGIGAGVADRAKELSLPVQGIKWGARASDPENYSNIKAQNLWELRLWIKGGGKVLYDQKLFEELSEIKYKIQSDKLIIIEPKEKMKSRIKRSPDRLDAFALTFNELEREPEAGILVG